MSLFSFTDMPAKLERLGGRIANAPIWESDFVRAVAAAVAVLLLAIVIAVPLDLVQQSVIAVIAYFAASKIRRLSWGRGGILIMVGISLLMTLRYLYWRLTVTLEFETTVDAVFGYLLLFAELYGITCLVLGYIQTAWPLERQPVMIDRPTSEWPSVDIFIPTYNEDLSVVRLSVLAALLAITLIKGFSKTSCPWDLQVFGGLARYVSHWDWFQIDGGGGHCFPAGHASTGFAFMAAYFSLRHSGVPAARLWLVCALLAGFVLGLSQQIRGAHFMSHTLWTAWLSWTVGWVSVALLNRLRGKS